MKLVISVGISVLPADQTSKSLGQNVVQILRYILLPVRLLALSLELHLPLLMKFSRKETGSISKSCQNCMDLLPKQHLSSWFLYRFQTGRNLLQLPIFVSPFRGQLFLSPQKPFGMLFSLSVAK